ncbi:hypothetical protein DKP76_07125 [Falsochrobactrum shanghaiense]|uniref:Uncharacterized protein n=1 Tax=Falsochrobactrum shanghaiense TaxID=2201899 RepID=A0A316JDZ0_9HYPH|nr:hypothetical protein [Falsochrobactrum shanghaiense]PWL18829.1 hypothetical protein DKP76_07125 [Falsochrobactrum shanghaiense]
MHVHFLESMDWSPRYGVTIAYPAGWSGSVTRRCGEAAIAAGKAERVTTPRRGADPEPGADPNATRDEASDGNP